MRRFSPLVAPAALAFACGAMRQAAEPAASRPAIHVAHDGLKKLSWQLAIPTGVFADKTVLEVIELLHGLDVHHLELTPGQMLSGERQVKAGHEMKAEDAAALLAKLKAVHMDIVAYGPVELGVDEASDRAVFAFAKLLKAKDVIAAPGAGSLEPKLGRLDKLATEYGVNLAVMIGARPPEEALKMLDGRSGRVGVYLDMESLADPLAAAKVLVGHVAQVRASGAGVAAMVGELKGQGFKGVVTASCAPGRGEAAVEAIAGSVNALSDAIEKAGAGK